MRKLHGLLCALTLAAFVPISTAADNPPPAAAAAAPAAAAPASAAPEQAPTALKSDKEKMSYCIGVQIWRLQVKPLSLDLDVDSVVQGIRDVDSGRPLALSDAEIQSALQKLQADVQQKQQEHMKEVTARMKEQGDKNKVEGPKFLAENKKKDGVVPLPSGLQYKVLKEGEGKLPGATDIMTINYRGTFLDGTEFDSSVKHGRPLDVSLDHGSIPGFLEALKLMKAGSKWMIYIPPDLAYGERGAPPVIAPDAVLVFEVEVLAIKEPPKEATPAPAR